MVVLSDSVNITLPNVLRLLSNLNETSRQLTNLAGLHKIIVKLNLNPPSCLRGLSSKINLEVKLKREQGLTRLIS
jgi:hypothetical protein